MGIKIFTIRLIITLYFLGTSNYSYQTMSQETVSQDKDAIKPSNKKLTADHLRCFLRICVAECLCHSTSPFYALRRIEEEMVR